MTDCVAPLPEAQDIAEDELVRRFLDAKRSRVDVQENKKPINKDIWNAFTTRKTCGRFVVFSGSVPGVIDTNEPPDGSIEITSDDLSFDTSGNRLPVVELFKKIAGWAERNNIEDDQLYESYVVRPKIPDNDERANLLELFLDQLTHEQLKRLTIPADIVQSLYKARLH